MCIIRPYRMRRVQICSLLLQIHRGLSVCLCVTNVSPINSAEPIEIPFGYVLGGPKEPYSWGLGSPRETGNLVYVACDATFRQNSLNFVKFVDYLLAHVKQFHVNVYEII